jgi:P-type conjugative transfer protein TrbJ
MSKTTRQRAVAILVATALSFTAIAVMPAPAAASIFGEENATLIAILAEDIEAVLQAYRTVEGIVQQITKLETMIDQGRTMLSQLDKPETYYNLLVFADRSTRTLQGLDRDITYLGYKLESIGDEHKKVFPTADSYSSMPTGDFSKRAQTWHEALRESSAIAMRAQTSVRTLEQRAQTQEQILSSSQSAQGVVGQLQAVVNSLALLHTDLTAIEENLAAGQRVTATWAGVHVSERELAQERTKRMMEGYTNPGAGAHLLGELP